MPHALRSLFCDTADSSADQKKIRRIRIRAYAGLCGSIFAIKGETNMILYFSGTGNSKYVAERLADALSDELCDLFQKIKTNDTAPMESLTPWIIVTPTYAWRIPHIVSDWLHRTKLGGCSNIYFVMTCGENIGNAGKYLAQLCAKKGLSYRGAAEIVMPENYIALFRTPTDAEAAEIVRNAEPVIDRTAEAIRQRLSLSQTKRSAADRISSGIVNDLFYPVFVHAKKFKVTDRCISCGKCAALCPLSNIRLADGKPVWGGACTHCMACICRCPAEAIEYGAHSKGLPRYVFREDFARTEGRPTC